MNASAWTPRFLAVSVVLGGCDGGDTAPRPDASGPALDVRLVVDPNQTTQADLAQRLTSLVVIVDADAGLYRPGEEASNGLVQVKNADADPADLEIVATIEVDGDTLPTFRLERGGLDDVPIDLRVLGFADAGASHVAEGTLRAARFDDAPRAVSLPFLLRASELPPRVVDVLPADGASIPGCSIPSVTLVFSRPIDPATLEAEGAVDIGPFGPPTSVVLDASGLVATLGTEGLAGVESLAFHLVVTDAVRAAEGGPALDQAPAEGGSQPYAIDVRLACTPPPTKPCTPGDPDPACGATCGGRECTPDPRVTCIDSACVLTGCAEACPEGSLCDASAAVCVPDCRTVDAIEGCAPPTTCDAASGACIAPR